MCINDTNWKIKKQLKGFNCSWSFMSLQKRFFGGEGGLKSIPSVTKETEVHLKSNLPLNPASMPEIAFFHTMSNKYSFFSDLFF